MGLIMNKKNSVFILLSTFICKVHNLHITVFMFVLIVYALLPTLPDRHAVVTDTPL